MFNLDPAKLLIIAVVAVILLGPDKLPQVARQLGAAWRSLNEFRHKMEAEVRGSIPDLPSTAEIAHFARSPTALLNRLSTMSDGDAVAANGTAEAGANGEANGHGALPDGTPFEPFAAGGAPLPSAVPPVTPGASPSESVEAGAAGAAFGDPTLN